jgi:hypothetical protein
MESRDISDVHERVGSHASDLVLARRFAEWMARGDAYWTAALEERGGDRTRARRLVTPWERENPPPRVTVSDVADHVEHIRKVAGIDHVGSGADFDGIPVTILSSPKGGARSKANGPDVSLDWTISPPALRSDPAAAASAVRGSGSTARAIP